MAELFARVVARHAQSGYRATALIGCIMALPWLTMAAPQAATDQPSAPTVAPTFIADVAPILRAKCLSCHREDGDAPVPLETISQVRRRASLIVQLTAGGHMPPWKPAPDSPAYIGERRLSDREKATLKQWVADGMPEGDASRSSLNSVANSSAWTWGPPDLVIPLPDYILPAGSSDVFRNFVVRVPFAGARFVRGFQFRPRSRAVHHANIRIDVTSASADLDGADPAPGYEGLILHSAQYPPGHFLGWTPGQASAPSGELSWQLNGGTDFVVQLHMRSTGQADHIRPLLGLYFTAEPPVRQPTMLRLGRQDLRMRAGEKNFISGDTFELPVPVTVMAIQAHSHYRARDVLLSAERAGAPPRTLLHISDWDFNWQDQYRLAQPIRLPAGTTLRSTFEFDNSNDNPRNPLFPAQEVQWGWRTSDEMADVWVQVFTDTAEDQQRLDLLARHKATAEDAIGSEILIAREPNHYNLRNDAALIYLELGQPLKAVEHFQNARRITPEAPAAAFNVGTALERAGRLDEAATAYREAIAMDGGYALAHARLATLLHRRGALAEAILAYRDAITLSARKASLQCELGKALLDVQRPLDAIEAFSAGLQSEADNIGCLVNVAWVRAAHDNPALRQPQVAIAAATRAVALSAGGALEAPALDALAAALASDGQFERAVATARRSILLTADASVRRAINERLSLYLRGLPFRVTTPPQ